MDVEDALMEGWFGRWCDRQEWTVDEIERQRADDYRRETEPDKRRRVLSWRTPQEPPQGSAGDELESGIK